MWGKTWRTNSSDHITYLQSSDVQILSSSHHLFRRLTLFSVIRGLAMAALPWMLDVWSSRRIVFVETVFKMGLEFCCHLCCSSAVMFRHSPLQYTAIPFTQLSLFRHRSSQLKMSSHDLCVSSWLWEMLLRIHLMKWPFGYRCCS